MPHRLLTVAAVLLAAIAGTGCGGLDCPSANRMEKTIAVDSLPDGADAGAGLTTAELVSRCQASVAATDCSPLCTRAVGGYYYFRTCELVGTDGGLAVHVVYENFCPV